MEKDFYKNYFEAEKNHWWFLVRRKIVRDLLKKYLDDKPQNIKLLDFGCGSGYLAGELKKTGYDTYGVDVSQEAVEYGKINRIENLSVYNSRLDFSDNFFDCVLALDVLEHLENERPVLSEIERVLKKGGVFIATAPAFKSLWGIQDEVSHHFRRYRLKQLVKLVNRDKFELLKSTYFNTFLFLPIAATRLVSRWLGLINRDSDFSLNNGFINQLLFQIFNTEAKFLKFIDFPFGVSILTVFRKKINE